MSGTIIGGYCRVCGRTGRCEHLQALKPQPEGEEAMTEKKTTYSLIAYKSSSDCSHRGCHRASYSSTCIHESGLSPEDLQDRIAELKATELDCCEGGYENIWWFEDPANLDLGVAFEDGIAEKTATILAEHKAKKDQKAADEKHRAQAQADARERAEFERLKTKFTPKEVVRP